MASTKNVMFIACGSFSPPTPMHLRMFEIARDTFRELGTHNIIGGIVSPVHDSYGKKGLIAGKHRCSMVKLALKSSEWIRMSDWECNYQDKWTTTRQVLQYHQNYINSYINDINGTSNVIIPSWIPDGINQINGTIQLKLICGGDLLESFSVPGLWKDEDIEAILGQHGLVVITRSGSNPEKFIFESDLLSKYKKNITIIPNWIANDVSSTIVRRFVSRGLSVKYLLDDYVIDYIKKNELYGYRETKYILTPNQNEIDNFVEFNPLNHYTNDNDNYIKDLNITNSLYNSMDVTDFSSMTDKTKLIDNLTPPSSRSKIFCCGGETLNVKSLLNRPGQAVKILTTSSSGSHTISHEDEVGECSNNISTITHLLQTPKSQNNKIKKSLEKKVEFLSDNHLNEIICDDVNEKNNGGGGGGDDNFDTISDLGMPSTSARTQNDLIKFVFTSHGIRVISDKEYVV